MDYIVTNGPGRAAFVRFWSLVAQAVKPHASAFAAELMNEPMSIRRRGLYDTWRAAAEAIHVIIPDMAVGLADPLEGALIPPWLAKLAGAGVAIDEDTVKWIRQSSSLFYVWHFYRGNYPKTAAEAVRDALAVGTSWGVPTFATEFIDCEVWRHAAEANISHTYWHYSCYCNTGPAFSNRDLNRTDTFGACILGWASGNASKKCLS